MKPIHKRLIAVCLAMSLVIAALVTWGIAASNPSIGPYPVTGNIPITGTLQLASSGSSTLVLTGGTISATVPPTGYGTMTGGTLALTGGSTGASLTGGASVPCSQLILSAGTAGCTLGSGTAASTQVFPIAANGTLTLSVSNANMIYVSGGTASHASYLSFQ